MGKRKHPDRNSRKRSLKSTYSLGKPWFIDEVPTAMGAKLLDGCHSKHAMGAGKIGCDAIM